MNKNIETEFLFLDVVGPIIHQVMQTNYHTPLKRAFQFVWTAWCVIWSITSKNRHSMLKCATSAKKIHGNCWWTNRSTERQRDSSKVIFSPFFEVGGGWKNFMRKIPRKGLKTIRPRIKVTFFHLNFTYEVYWKIIWRVWVIETESFSIPYNFFF